MRTECVSEKESKEGRKCQKKETRNFSVYEAKQKKKKFFFNPFFPHRSLIKHK